MAGGGDAEGYGEGGCEQRVNKVPMRVAMPRLASLTLPGPRHADCSVETRPVTTLGGRAKARGQMRQHTERLNIGTGMCST